MILAGVATLVGFVAYWVLDRARGEGLGELKQSSRSNGASDDNHGGCKTFDWEHEYVKHDKPPSLVEELDNLFRVRAGTFR